MQILGLGDPIPEMGWKQWSLQGSSCGATGWPLGLLFLWESGPGPFAAAITGRQRAFSNRVGSPDP